MVVTTPGFVLGERVWIGWFPHTLWADQLPTFVASVAGIVVVGRLARWWGLSAPAALVAAGLVAVAASDVVYATRVKPYAFDLLGACLVLWLAERVRRHGPRDAPWLAVASVAVCAFSLTPVPLVVGVWLALGAESLVRRTMPVRLAASGAGTALGLGALWLAVRGGVSPRLRTSWDGYYLVVTSAHGFAHSARTIVDGLVAGIGVDDAGPRAARAGHARPRRAPRALRRRAREVAAPAALLAAIATALVLSIPCSCRSAPGAPTRTSTRRSRMVVAEGATVAWHAVRRAGRPLAVAALAGSLVVAGLLGGRSGAAPTLVPGRELRPRVLGRSATELARGRSSSSAAPPAGPGVLRRSATSSSSTPTSTTTATRPRSDRTRVVLIPGSPSRAATGLPPEQRRARGPRPAPRSSTWRPMTGRRCR